MKIKDLSIAALIAYFVSIFAYILEVVVEVIYNISPMKLNLSEYIVGLLYMPFFIFPFIFIIGVIMSFILTRLFRNFYLKLCVYILLSFLLSIALTPIIFLFKLTYVKIVFIISMLIFNLLIEKLKIIN
jgi:hypothetical protein